VCAGWRFNVMIHREQEDRTKVFDGLVHEHQAGLRAFIRALGAADIWVDDLAQETFLTAYRRWDDFDPQADFGRWLRGIARNLVANERRKTARQSRLLPHALADLLLEHAPEDSGGQSFDELAPALRQCVEQLPPCSRELLTRRYAESQNASVLAQVFQTTAEAIRQQLVRIRTVVKECIQRKMEARCL